MTKITGIRSICTAPADIRLVVVRVETDDPGLTGLGCATFTQRALAVVEAVDQYLAPFLTGRDVAEIEDIFHTSQLSSYWRAGPVLNNALSGVDMALWDIKGKKAGMPVHDLLGGKCRQAVRVYVHASGDSIDETIDQAQELIEQGFSHIRLQSAVPGQSTYGTASDLQTLETIDGPTNPLNVFEPADYARLIPRLFEVARERLGWEVELLHDIHERLPPQLAIQLAKDLEPYRLFFYEDALPPEEVEYFRQLREQSSIPIAMGELFVNLQQCMPLVEERLIDFMRVHLSMIGGLTPARKLAVFCELYGVRSAWHGPGDCSPIGHAANVALDLASPNFGIQEFTRYNDEILNVFPGCNELRDGCLWPNNRPGWGIEIDEKLAAKFPFPEHPYEQSWPMIRNQDGGIIRP